MKDYDTLSEAVNDLESKGYTYDFNLLENEIESKALKRKFGTADFNVVEYYRFEGMTSTDDESVLYVIETTDGTKGMLIDAYGMYSDSISDDMLEKLKIVH